MKDYEGPDKEIEQAVQMCVTEVSSEDPRYLERDPPPIAEEFPEGSKVFFLGEHAYGVAAQVSGTTEDTLAVILAVSTLADNTASNIVSDHSLISFPPFLSPYWEAQFYPTERSEAEKFKAIVDSRKSSRYFPSYRVADMVGLSGRALGKITSSFMVLTSDEQKTNLGLSLKFEAKALKVVDYSRKEGRSWEYSEKAIQLIKDYKVPHGSQFLLSRPIAHSTLLFATLNRLPFRRCSLLLIMAVMVCGPRLCQAVSGLTYVVDTSYGQG